MKQIFLTIAGTAVVFGAGVWAGMWMQRTQPLPPPPMGIMGEIRDVPLSGNGQPSSHGHADLKAELERMQPEIDAFKKKLDPIKDEFRQSLETQLRPDQKEKLKALSERWNSTTPPTTSHPGHPPHFHDGLESLFPIVLVANTLERLTDELKLDGAQQASVRDLLLQRRAKFLDLVDHSPPPSLRLGRLAPLAPQNAETEKK
jgi:hypothetical protein